MSMTTTVRGSCDSAFAPLRSVLEDSITPGEDLGASIVVNIDGKTLVDHRRCHPICLYRDPTSLAMRTLTGPSVDAAAASTCAGASCAMASRISEWRSRGTISRTSSVGGVLRSVGKRTSAGTLAYFELRSHRLGYLCPIRLMNKVRICFGQERRTYFPRISGFVEKSAGSG